ncbi:MAG TPA: hypothetical protein VK790_08790 [Solirubrobacteraceae bacterium]|nr:hypothetical protein [Solirubrobacteraceae bacterium]
MEAALENLDHYTDSTPLTDMTPPLAHEAIVAARTSYEHRGALTDRVRAGANEVRDRGGEVAKGMMASQARSEIDPIERGRAEAAFTRDVRQKERAQERGTRSDGGRGQPRHRDDRDR